MLDTLIENRLLPVMFKLSDEPMLYRELLHANRLYDQGYKLEGNISGMRIRVGRTILIFAILWHIAFILPGMALYHHELAKMDCHLGIILAVVFTGFFFSSYFVFKEWAIERMAQQQIRKAWKNHFAHFDYKLHHREVAALYSKALEDEIPTKELQLYILNNMIRDKEK